MAIAVYPGSFDPVTKGHIDVAERAASLFEELIVAIYDAPPKHVLFNTEERVELMRKALSHIPNVRVDSFAGLTVEYAKKIRADVIVRGLRVNSDFEKEFEMALMNRKLAPEVELICFMTNLEYEFVSSSLLKEISKLGGSIEDFVPEHVAAALKEKFSHEDC